MRTGDHRTHHVNRNGTGTRNSNMPCQRAPGAPPPIHTYRASGAPPAIRNQRAPGAPPTVRTQRSGPVLPLRSVCPGQIGPPGNGGPSQHLTAHVPGLLSQVPRNGAGQPLYGRNTKPGLGFGDHRFWRS